MSPEPEVKWEPSVPKDDDAYVIRFSGEADDTFQKFLYQLSGFDVQVRTKDDEVFDCELKGSHSVVRIDEDGEPIEALEEVEIVAVYVY